MNELLDLAIAAHGGMERWRGLSTIAARISTGGLLFAAKWKLGALRDVEGRVECSTPCTVFSPYSAQGRRGVFEPGKVWIETEGRNLLQERKDPRAAFRGLRRTIYWDHLDLLYFAGYGLWNYLCAPFFLALPDFEFREIEPWEEDGERWRCLQVYFPPSFPTHSREQVLYFDERGLIRRLDYTAEPVGSWAKAAHYCLEHKTFSGLVVPTRRRVVPRRADGRALQGPTLVWIEISDVKLSCGLARRCRGPGPPPLPRAMILGKGLGSIQAMTLP